MAGTRSFRSSRAFLVRAADMGETDRRLTFFTEADGALTAVAKAARRSRKRFGGALQKYFLLDVVWTEEPKRMPILTSASILASFWEIVANWERVRYADYLLELVSSLFPQAGPQSKAFAFLLAGFRSLSAGESPVSVGRKAEAAFIALGGWGPDLSACRGCGREESRSFHFVVSEGRLYCGACTGRAGNLLSLGAVRTWRALQASSPATVGRIRIPESVLEELQTVIPKYLMWNFGGPFRSLGGDPTVGKP
ncbi:MAG: DNA repair protein RecO [Deltaproteobacteria bacterium]|jgi:DNA repair protein RecO (recombination protein O)|nr:DNA repair protein RecO [Deltaproteobacteria bacterium]